MSHFCVLVIGQDIEKQLQPYHEFECTGDNDEFVQDIDETSDTRGEYEACTRTMVRLADGSLVGAYEARFQVKVKEDGDIFPKTKYVYPEGHELVEVKATDLQSYVEWLKDWEDIKVVAWGDKPDLDGAHKYRYAALDADGNVSKVVRRTNPNKKWDWWVVGGRWSGFLKLKDGAKGALGQKGLMGSCASNGPGRADQVTKSAIDFDGMRREAGAKASAKWEKARAALVAAGAPLTWITWEHMRDVEHKGSIDTARDAYGAQHSVRTLREAFKGEFFLEADKYLVPHEVYTQQASNSAVAPYALVKDGKWLSKGEMGWFGMSSGDEDQDTWNRKINELLDSLPDDALITVVDCHI